MSPPENTHDAVSERDTIHKRASRRRLGIVIVILAVAAIGVRLAPRFLPYADWDSAFPLTIDVTTSGEKPHRAVYGTADTRAAAAAMHQRIAQDLAAGNLPADCENAIPRDGGFVASIWCSGTSDVFDVEVDYREPRFLVLGLLYPGERWAWHALEIPAGRGPRTVALGTK